MPRILLFSWGARAWVRQVNAIISRYDRAGSAEGDPRATYIDIGDKFLKPDGTLDPDLTVDGSEPSAKGFQVWADAVQPVVEQSRQAHAVIF